MCNTILKRGAILLIVILIGGNASALDPMIPINEINNNNYQQLVGKYIVITSWGTSAFDRANAGGNVTNVIGPFIQLDNKEYKNINHVIAFKIYDNMSKHNNDEQKSWWPW